MNLDYESLRLIYWAILVIAVLGFVLGDGLVSAATMLLPLIGTRNDDSRHIAPMALGLQAWSFTAAVMAFAAWPIAYAVLFSSLQTLLLLMLLAWIARLLSLYFENPHPFWQRNRHKFLLLSGLIPAISLGLIGGNLLKGIPFHLDSDMRIFFLGDFWGLINPFTLLVAAVSVSLLALYGSAYWQLKMQGESRQRSTAYLYKSGIAFLVLFALTGLWITRLEGYHISSDIFPNGISNPLAKFVKRSEGLWLDNYEHQPTLWLIPALSFLAAAAALYLSKRQHFHGAFIAASLTVAMTALTAAVSLFPFLLPSNRSLNSSLTIWDASASQNTLSALLWLALVALPLWALASRWVFCLWQDKPEIQEAPISLSRSKIDFS